MALVQGIDTGAWRVRIASMEGSFRRFALRDVQEMDASVGMQEAIEAIRANEPRWEDAERVAALSLGDAAVRLIRLPFSDRAVIARALPAEVEANVPYDLDDMVLVNRIIDTAAGQSRTLTIIASKEAVGTRIDALRAAHAEPRGMCLDAEALATYADRGVQVVIDVGHARTLVTLCQNGHAIACRMVASGGLAVTEAIATLAGVEPGQAEAWKHAATVPPGELGGTAVEAEWAEADRTDSGAPEQRAYRALIGSVDAWCMDVRALLIALEDEHAVGIDDLLLAGGGAQLGGLSDRLARVTGVPVRSVVVPGGHPASCALAVALARVAAGEGKFIEIREGEFAYHGHADTLWNVVLAGVGATSLLVLGGFVLFGLKVHDANSRLSELDARMAGIVTDAFPEVSADKVAEPSMALAIMQEKTGETTKRVDALGSTISGVPPTLDTLREISARVPPPGEAKIDVRELTIGEDAISFKAETDSYEAAAKIEESLKQSPAFAGAKKGDEKKIGEVLTFSVTIPRGEVVKPLPEEG